MGYRYAVGAARVCRQQAFREYVTHTLGHSVDDDATAAQAMRDLCRVQSRAEFDTDAAARDRYLAMVDDMNQWLARGRRG